MTDENKDPFEERWAELDRWQKALNRQQKKSVQNVARLERSMNKQLHRSRVLLDDVQSLVHDVRKALRQARENG
jgi:transcriptional regulator NrdR family protein